MHAEWYSLPPATVEAVGAARARGARIVAVGTTTLRALESAARADGGMRAGAAETSLFITPGFRFGVVDRLVTNFHLPRSTLLMLVSAFAGYDAIRAAMRTRSPPVTASTAMATPFCWSATATPALRD